MQPPHTRTSQERGSALVIALLLIVLLLSLGSALLMSSGVELTIAKNDELSEGAFYAAEAATQLALRRITEDFNTSTEAISATELGDDFSFRTGARDDTSAQPIDYLGSVPGAGYAMSGNTAYNASGFVFDVYQINATGTGPRNTSREVELRVEYGPIVR